MRLVKILIAIVAAYGLNLIWERAQAPLYTGYENFWANLPMCAKASLGDVIVVAAIYACCSRGVAIISANDLRRSHSPCRNIWRIAAPAIASVPHSLRGRSQLPTFDRLRPLRGMGARPRPIFFAKAERNRA